MKKLLIKFAYYILKKWGIVPFELGDVIFFRGSYFRIFNINWSRSLDAVDEIEIIAQGGWKKYGRNR